MIAPPDRPPVDRPPVDRPPVDRPPVDRPPVDRPPVDRPPVALVTGGARRIGATLCRSLATDGWRVAIHCRASRDEAEALALEIGGGAFVVAADFAARAEVDALIPAVAARAGGLDLLVNNASLFSYDDISTLTWESFDRHIQPNLAAPLMLARDFAAVPRGPHPRNIVNILDEKVGNLNPDFLSYTISKVGLSGATEILAMAFERSIRVNAIAPGLTLRSGKQTDEAFERAWRATPLGLSATPEEIAEALAFILETPSLVGQTIRLDGGIGLVKRARDVAFEDFEADGGFPPP